MESNEELVDQIAAFLEEERTRFRKAAQALGMPPSIQRLIPIATSEITEHSLQTTYQPVEEGPVGEMAASALAQALPERSAPAPIAEALVRAYGDGCRTWSAVFEPSWENEPTRWVQARLLDPLVWDYVIHLKNLDRPDEGLAASLASGLLRLVSSERVTFMTALALAGITFDEDPVIIDNVSFRRLSPTELGSLTDDAAVLPHRRRDSVLFPNYEHPSERWLMEVRTDCAKTEQPMADSQPQRVLLALQLLGYDLHGRGRARNWTEPGPSLWHGGQRYRLPKYGATRVCPPHDLARALKLAGRIPENLFAQTETSMEVALHRFHLGCAEDVDADALIDFAIALEAALLHDNKELSFKMRLFGACYLETESQTRRRIFDRLGKVYGTRSSLVHGGRVDPEQIKVAAQDAREFAGRVLVKALEEGWPSSQELEGLVLT